MDEPGLKIIDVFVCNCARSSQATGGEHYIRPCGPRLRAATHRGRPALRFRYLYSAPEDGAASTCGDTEAARFGVSPDAIERF
jgi:hypothetical protein